MDVAERYLPGVAAEDIGASALQVSAAADDLAREGVGVRYLGSTILPTDEAVFDLFVASSEEAVQRVSSRAGATFARILTAVLITPGDTRRGGGDHDG